MKLFKTATHPIETFRSLILEEQYVEAMAFAIDNRLEREALAICIKYIQEDDERTEQEMKHAKSLPLRDIFSHVHLMMNPIKVNPGFILSGNIT